MLFKVKDRAKSYQKSKETLQISQTKMDANLTNRFGPYEAFSWNQNPMNVTGLSGAQGLFPTWNQLNHQFGINHVTPSFHQDTERTHHAIPAADNLMATPSTSNPDVDCQSNRHNFYGTSGI